MENSTDNQKRANLIFAQKWRQNTPVDKGQLVSDVFGILHGWNNQ
jgi:hypothetical protein